MTADPLDRIALAGARRAIVPPTMRLDSGLDQATGARHKREYAEEVAEMFKHIRAALKELQPVRDASDKLAHTAEYVAALHWDTVDRVELQIEFGNLRREAAVYRALCQGKDEGPK